MIVFGENMNFAQKLRSKITKDVFSHDDLKIVLPAKSDASIHNGITRSIHAGSLIRLKRGLYAFSDDLRRGAISKFLIANNLYKPSYVSFESALSHHGIIPEAVYTTTSACLQNKPRTFSNKFGSFSFEPIPSNPFFMGVTNINLGGGVLIATGLKALFDFVYLHKKNYKKFEELEDDLRIDRGALEKEIVKVTTKELEILTQSYNRKAMYNLYLTLLREFK